jgi:hypothetical protein
LGIAAFEHRWLVDLGFRAAGIADHPVATDGVTRVPRHHRRTAALADAGRLALAAGDPGPPGPGPPASRASSPSRHGWTTAAGRAAGPAVPAVPVRPVGARDPDRRRQAAARRRGAGHRAPREQHCCGLPAYDAGEQDAARDMVRQTMDTLEGVDDVVTPASSCLAMLKPRRPHLLRGDVDEVERAQQLAGRTYDLISYLTARARPAARRRVPWTTATAPR